MVNSKAPLWALFAVLLMITCYLVMQAFIEGTVFTGLVYSAVALPLWPSFMAYFAIFNGHYRWQYGLYVTGIWLTWDLLGLNYALVDLLDLVFGLGNNAQWSTLFLLFIAILGLMVSIIVGKRTLFRIIIFVMLMAQLIVIPLFHLVTIDMPMEADTELVLNERIRIKEFSSERIKQYCEDRALLCYQGNIEQVSESIKNLPQPQMMLSILMDVQNEPDFYYTWHGLALPGTLSFKSLRHATLFKRDGINYILIDRNEPNKRFIVWSIGFSLLSNTFHLVWIGLILYILGRHKKYYFNQGKWHIYINRNKHN